MATQSNELRYCNDLAFMESGFNVCLPFLFLRLGGRFFGGVEFEDVGEEKTGEGFDNVVGDFFFLKTNEGLIP